MIQRNHFYFIIISLSFLIAALILLLLIAPVIIVLWVTGLVTKIGVVDIGGLISGKLNHFYLEEIRDDLVDIISRDAVKWDTEGVDEELKKIKSKGEKRHEYGELLLTSLITIFAISAELFNLRLLNGILGGWETEALLLLLTILILFRVSLLNRLTYSGIDDVETGDLETALSWQRTVCIASFAAPFLLSMSMVRKIFGKNRYQSAMDILSDFASGEKLYVLFKKEFSKRV